MASNSDDSFFNSCLGPLLGLYFVISQIMAVYFWYQFAKVDGFLTTITIDVILAELKGIFWIFFVW